MFQNVVKSAFISTNPINRNLLEVSLRQVKIFFWPWACCVSPLLLQYLKESHETDIIKRCPPMSVVSKTTL